MKAGHDGHINSSLSKHDCEMVLSICLNATMPVKHMMMLNLQNGVNGTWQEFGSERLFQEICKSCPRPLLAY